MKVALDVRGRDFIELFIERMESLSLRGGAFPPKQSPTQLGIASGKKQERPRNDV
jgi:hypothetical protein